MTKISAFLSTSLCLTLSVTSMFIQAKTVSQPNIVWIISEDNSSHYLKHFSEQGIETPNITALAKSGLTFDNAYSNSPVCSVARTTLATGVYAPRIGTQYHRADAHVPQTSKIRLFQTYLREQGYYTTNNAKTDYNVTADQHKGWNESSKKASWRNRPDSKQPFFHVETHHDSHEGRMHFSKDEFIDKSKGKALEHIIMPEYLPNTLLSRFTYQSYLEKISAIDKKVGETVAKLKSDGLLEDTFIFYFGDHGGVLPRSKGYVFDSGLRVPLVVKVPRNFKHQIKIELPARINGAVEFVDFAPTMLTLAGSKLPKQFDGQAFLGESISMDEVNSRDETYAYADRFDEKYDFVRSLKKGNLRYIRNYQSYLPNGLQNNYRYRMLAYQEWRQLYQQGKLNNRQSQFFKAKPAEMLFDTSNDPHEVHNLASDPDFQAELHYLRSRLRTKVNSLPDLGVYPESYLIENAMPNVQDFARNNRGKISELFDIADLSLLPFSDVKAKLIQYITAKDAMKRLWAVTVATNFGIKATSLTPQIEALLDDNELTVRIRAAEFLGVIEHTNPQPILADIINQTDSPTVAAEALNSVVFFHDFSNGRYRAILKAINPRASGRGIKWRMAYLAESTSTN